ncbi:hypothetical protein D0T49_11295 [Paludibacter sp. 221]|nr:hypothetical protein [Paludibacter sp. 221]
MKNDNKTSKRKNTAEDTQTRYLHPDKATLRWEYNGFKFALPLNFFDIYKKQGLNNETRIKSTDTRF